MNLPEPRSFCHLGAALGLIREVLRGMTQTECARRAGVTKAQLSRFEIGSAAPTLESLEKILRALEVGPAEFFAIVAAVGSMVAGEVSVEAIKRRVLKRQRAILDDCLGGVARVRLQGCPVASLSSAGGRRSSAWSKALLIVEGSGMNPAETTLSETGDAQAD